MIDRKGGLAALMRKAAEKGRKKNRGMKPRGKGGRR